MQSWRNDTRVRAQQMSKQLRRGQGSLLKSRKRAERQHCRPPCSQAKSAGIRLYTHDPEEVAVGRADVNLPLDERLPLLDERAELVAGEVHPVEVGEDRGALDVLAAQLHLPVPLRRENRGARQDISHTAEQTSPGIGKNQARQLLVDTRHQSLRTVGEFRKLQKSGKAAVG